MGTTARPTTGCSGRRCEPPLNRGVSPTPYVPTPRSRSHMDLVRIPGYSESDWHNDRQAEAQGTHLSCPNCGRDEWYHPVGIPPGDGSQRKYRACKACGFWQEADGTPAYRCLMTTHVCLSAIPSGKHCAYCGAWGPRHWHAGCWRILPPNEIGVTSCANCALLLSDEYVVPWPVRTT